MIHKRRLISLSLVFIAILAFDYLSKFLVQAFLPLIETASPFYPYGGIPIFRDLGGIDFSLTYATNKGAAWGMFSQFQSYLIILRICLIIFLASYMAFFNKESRSEVPLTWILAGACGNVLDYFLYGHVIDMLYFNLWGYSFPIFNVADSFITIGICWLFVQNLLAKKKAALKD